MNDLIKRVELLPQGILITLIDGREGLLDPVAVMQCFKDTGAQARLTDIRATLRTETQADSQD